MARSFKQHVRCIGFVTMLFFSTCIQASHTCHGRFVNPLNDVCWTCLFPLTIGSAKIMSGKSPDTKNPSSPICTCPGAPLRVGLAMGYWEPIGLVDVTRHPYCFLTLGGMSMNVGKKSFIGTSQTANTTQNHSFYHVHWIRYPLLSWLNLITDSICVDKGDVDIPYLSELDPTWNDDELNFIINPESVLFSTPLSQAACAADSVLALKKLAADKLFWCAGAQGSMYPLSGHVSAHVGGVQASSLLAQRLTYKLHRLSLLRDSSGKSGAPLCHQTLTPIMPKSRYRLQMVAPHPTSGACYPFGRTTTLWEANREFPVKGEDFGYLIWRKRNCCAL